MLYLLECSEYICGNLILTSRPGAQTHQEGKRYKNRSHNICWYRLENVRIDISLFLACVDRKSVLLVPVIFRFFQKRQLMKNCDYMLYGERKGTVKMLKIYAYSLCVLWIVLIRL